MANEDKTTVVKKYVCSTCHGTGEITCSKCGGKGERTCPHCDGTGHACPVCSRGYVKKTRWINCKDCSGTGYKDNGWRCSCCDGRGQVKETYKELCPNCHGDYKNTDHVCDKCDGRKKISCAKHEDCPDCHGKGRWSKVYNKVSAQNIRVFRALGMIGGLFGLHYAYVRRWCLFVVQLTLVAVSAVLFCGLGMIAEIFNIDSYTISMVKLWRWVVVVITLLHWLIGIRLVKRDGQGGKLKDEFKQGLFWVFFLPFGLMGAHLAYIGSALLVIHAGVLILFLLGAIGRMDFIGAGIGMLHVCGFMALVELLVLIVFGGIKARD